MESKQNKSSQIIIKKSKVQISIELINYTANKLNNVLKRASKKKLQIQPIMLQNEMDYQQMKNTVIPPFAFIVGDTCQTAEKCKCLCLKDKKVWENDFYHCIITFKWYLKYLEAPAHTRNRLLKQVVASSNLIQLPANKGSSKIITQNNTCIKESETCNEHQIIQKKSIESKERRTQKKENGGGTIYAYHKTKTSLDSNDKDSNKMNIPNESNLLKNFKSEIPSSLPTKANSFPSYEDPKISFLEIQFDSLKQIVNEMRETNTQMKSELIKQKNEYETNFMKQKETNEQLQKKNEELERQLIKLRESDVHLQKKNDELESQLIKHSLTDEQLQKKNEKLENSLKRVIREIGYLQDDMDELYDWKFFCVTRKKVNEVLKIIIEQFFHHIKIEKILKDGKKIEVLRFSAKFINKIGFDANQIIEKLYCIKNGLSEHIHLAFHEREEEINANEEREDIFFELNTTVQELNIKNLSKLLSLKKNLATHFFIGYKDDKIVEYYKNKASTMRNNQ